MKAIIIDDEKRARHLLTELVQSYCSQITQIIEAPDLATGVNLIKEESPQLVFLDIEMPNESGLKILDYFSDQVPFNIIFVTAYNHYAVEAFKLSAIDYLLKPVDVDELQLAVNKAITALQAKDFKVQLNKLRESLKKLSYKKIVLEIPKGIMFTSHDDILYFQADGMYTNVKLKDGTEKVICKPLKHFVDQLADNPMFFKSHRSYFINLNYVEELTKKDGDYVIMSDQKEIPISKSNKEQFMKVIKEIFL
ncbi:MAG TPA: response regulator transcription factor [Flavobacteriales bacterium]|jgi:two-component system LytT family response regulator|nr:response regulator transcription factor [Flavobacteriales bacterium]